MARKRFALSPIANPVATATLQPFACVVFCFSLVTMFCAFPAVSALSVAVVGLFGHMNKDQNNSERPTGLLLSLGVPSRPSPGSDPGPAVPSRFTMCFVLQRFGPVQVPRWGPSRPVLVPSVPSRIGPGRAETDFLATSDFFPVLKPLACGRQSRCLGWTYKLPGGQRLVLSFPLFL